MEAHSNKTFLEIIEEQKGKLLNEGDFVKGNEDTELPPTGEEPAPEEPTGEEQPPVEQPEAEVDDLGAFTNREIDILNTALRLYRDNDNYSIESKNDLGQLFDQGKHKELLGRLISVADELIS